MQVAFRLAYSVAVAILLILVVVFGTRTIYSEPNDYPVYPQYSGRNLYCNENNRCYIDDREITTVFITAAVLGVAAIAAGVALYRRVEGMPLGLVLGGIGAVVYGWAESSDGPGDVGSAPMFILALVGLVIVLGVGYWFLGGREKPESASRQAQA
jgi:hypothetical protein